MNIYKHVLIFFVFTLCLTGCSLNSVNEDAADHFKKENPLEVDITVPQRISLNEPQTFKVILKQNGKEVYGVNDVLVTIWKKGSSTPTEPIAASNDGKVEYSVEQTFHVDGLYYVKVQASSHGSTVMPTKQFIVGNLSEEELNDFQKNSSKQNQHHEEHH